MLKNKKTLLQITLCLLALLMAFTSCKGNASDPNNTETNEQTTEAQTEAPKPDNWFTADTAGAINLAEYVVVRPEDSSTAMNRISTQLTSYINLNAKIDIDQKRDDSDPVEKEILLGRTNRPESIEAYKTMKERNWSVTMVGNKIVIAAGVEEALPLAVEWFKANCTQQGNAYAVIGEGGNYSYQYPVSNIVIGDVSILDATVTYLDKDQVGYVDAAYSLAFDILDRFGGYVGVKEYDETATGLQILVASAKQAEKYLPDGVTVDKNQYYLNKSGNTVYVIGDSAIGAEIGVQAIIDCVKFDADGNADIASVFSAEVKSYTYKDNTFALLDGSDYRVMSFNVLRAELNQDDRFENVLNSILYYTPDVVGFQEYCNEFTATHTPMLEENGYTVIDSEVVTIEDDASTAQYDESVNMTPIAFKTEKFELIDSGWVRMANTYDKENGKNYPGHHITWVVLKDKSTQQTFAVTSTHFFHLNDVTAAAPVRNENANELLGIINSIITKHNCPVIAVGDYNANESEETYKTLEGSDVLADARDVVTNQYGIGTASHKYQFAVQSPTDSAEMIDHIFTTEDMTVVRHKIAINQLTADASDHFPVFVDIAFD